MGRRSLTAKQHAVLEFVRKYVEENGYWPTYKAISEEFDFRSPNSVTQNLKALIRKRYVRKARYGYELMTEGRSNYGIPIRGVIAAGQLQEAVESDLGTITLETLFPNLNRMYALRVSGQSMKGVDIADGDYVLLVDDDIPNGGIGAVLYNGETSLKRIYVDSRGVRLEPANPEYDEIHITPDIFEEVQVLGRYVGHVNRTGVHKPESVVHLPSPGSSRYRRTG